MNTKTIRIALWSLVAVVAVGATGLYAYSAFSRPNAVDTFGAGDYQLVSSEGTPFNRQSLDGHPSMLFFGFTHCPEVCPTTLAEITTWYETLGDEAKDLKAYFVTVDPERDTAEIVGNYVAWTERVTGITGSVEEIEKMAKAWGVYHQKVPLDGGDYTMDHTASVYLLNGSGEFEGTIAYREDANTAVGKIRKLLAKG